MTKLETLKQILTEYKPLIMTILFTAIVGFMVFFVAKTVGHIDQPKHVVIPYIQTSPSPAGITIIKTAP